MAVGNPPFGRIGDQHSLSVVGKAAVSFSRQLVVEDTGAALRSAGSDAAGFADLSLHSAIGNHSRYLLRRPFGSKF
jgi:hypothetical protein